ncbi:MAG: GntR family transcriptional regulator [Lentisphaeria bacterium]|nr:GntR family transcriptional regulator [Lentisphaeria bacterium]
MAIRMGKNKKNTSMEIAYQGILQKIMHEQFEPGMPLREDHLATELGVSSTPIREAFRRLEYEGWLQSSPFRGVFLRKFTREDICELYYLRGALESAAAAAAAKNATPEDLEKIHQSLESEQEYIRTYSQQGNETIKPNIEQDLIFHAAITDAAHNRLLSDRLYMLKAQTSYAFLNWRTTDTFSIKDSQRVLEEHWMIYLTIQRHWDDLAKSLMEKHISFARENHLKYLETYQIPE